MNRILSSFALAATLVLPVAAGAQTQPPQPVPPAGVGAPAPSAHHGRHHHGMGRFLRELNLTDAQKAQIKQIEQNAHAQFKGQQNVDPAARRAAMQKMHADVEAVLTPQQRAQLQQKMQQWKSEHQSEKREGSPAPK